MVLGIFEIRRQGIKRYRNENLEFKGQLDARNEW